MSKNNKTTVAICLTALLLTTTISAESNQKTTPSIKLELPIAPVGSSNQQAQTQLLLQIINELNLLLKQMANQMSSQNEIVKIGAANSILVEKNNEGTHEGVLIGLSPGKSQIIIENPALNTAMLNALKSADEKNISLYFHAMGKTSFEHTNELVIFCTHYNAIFAPIKIDPYWIIRSFNPMIGHTDGLKVPLDKFPPFTNLTPDQQKEVLQVLPHLHFIDEKGGYYVMHPEDQKLNIYYYDKQTGQRALIKQENMPKIGDSLFNHAFNEMISHLKQATKTDAHHKTDEREKK